MPVFTNNNHEKNFFNFCFYSTFSFGKINDFPPQPSRDWENINGDKINAKLLSFNSNTMNLKLQKNGEFQRIFGTDSDNCLHVTKNM